MPPEPSYSGDVFQMRLRVLHGEIQGMLLQTLREEVLAANLELVRHGTVLSTFGNVSGIARRDGLVALKPSGVPYKLLTPAGIVVSQLAGAPVDGTLNPSSDLWTHLELCSYFPTIGGVAHTHSDHATAWAQAQCQLRGRLEMRLTPDGRSEV